MKLDEVNLRIFLCGALFPRSSQYMLDGDVATLPPNTPGVVAIDFSISCFFMQNSNLPPLTVPFVKLESVTGNSITFDFMSSSLLPVRLRVRMGRACPPRRINSAFSHLSIRIFLKTINPTFVHCTPPRTLQASNIPSWNTVDFLCIHAAKFR